MAMTAVSSFTVAVSIHQRSADRCRQPREVRFGRPVGAYGLPVALHRTVHFAKVDDPFALLTIDPPTQHQEQQLRRYHASTRTPPRARPGSDGNGLYPFE